MFSVSLDDDAVMRALSRLDRGLGNLTAPMAEIGEALAESSRTRIPEGVSPDGTPFAPRSPTTTAHYGKMGWPFKGPLEKSGRMASQIFHRSDATSAEVGSNAIQAAVMQFGAAQGAFGKTKRGGPIPWGDIPARPFLGISDGDRTAIVQIVEDWLERLSDESG